MQKVKDKSKPFGPKPKWKSKEKGQARGITEEVQFIRFGELVRREAVFLSSCGVVEDLFGDDVLNDEEDGAGKGGHQADQICIEIGRACQYDS